MANEEITKQTEVDVKIDYKRQNSIISPADFNNEGMRIDVIGVGATGSYVVLQLAKMGLFNIHVWDADVVEGHNLPNQLYGLQDIGKPKVEALKQIVKSLTDVDIITHQEFVTAETKGLGNIVFLLTDSMSSRKEIYENCLKYNPLTRLCIETRLAATQGRIYAFDPTDMVMQEMWEETLYSDVEAEVSECGTTIVMGASSSLIASMAVWQMIKWYKGTHGDEANLPEFELFVFISPKFSIKNLRDDFGAGSIPSVSETIEL